MVEIRFNAHVNKNIHCYRIQIHKTIINNIYFFNNDIIYNIVFVISLFKCSPNPLCVCLDYVILYLRILCVIVGHSIGYQIYNFFALIPRSFRNSKWLIYYDKLLIDYLRPSHTIPHLQYITVERRRIYLHIILMRLQRIY